MPEALPDAFEIGADLGGSDGGGGSDGDADRLGLDIFCNLPQLAQQDELPKLPAAVASAIEQWVQASPDSVKAVWRAKAIAKAGAQAASALSRRVAAAAKAAKDAEKEAAKTEKAAAKAAKAANQGKQGRVKKQELAIKKGLLAGAKFCFADWKAAWKATKAAAKKTKNAAVAVAKAEGKKLHAAMRILDECRRCYHTAEKKWTKGQGAAFHLYQERQRLRREECELRHAAARETKSIWIDDGTGTFTPCWQTYKETPADYESEEEAEPDETQPEFWWQHFRKGGT